MRRVRTGLRPLERFKAYVCVDSTVIMRNLPFLLLVVKLPSVFCYFGNKNMATLAKNTQNSKKKLAILAKQRPQVLFNPRRAEDRQITTPSVEEWVVWMGIQAQPADPRGRQL